MSSFINKIASTVSNSASSIVGRDNMTKLTNSINRSIIRSKYREYMKHGNVVQLISKTSHQSLHICTSKNDVNRLILLGNGQIGIEYLNAHFVIEMDPKSSHIKFKNRNNYMAYDNEVPCVLAEVPNPKSPKEAIRTRNEFRLVELIGSEEWFALESVYYPGRYIAVLPDGSITSTRDRTDQQAQFCLHVIHVPQQNLHQGSVPFVYTPPLVSVSEAAGPAVPPATQPAPFLSAPPAPVAVRASSKEEEAAAYVGYRQEQSEAAAPPAPSASTDIPPNYSNLFPQLPKY